MGGLRRFQLSALALCLSLRYSRISRLVSSPNRQKLSNLEMLRTLLYSVGAPVGVYPRPRPHGPPPVHRGGGWQFGKMVRAAQASTMVKPLEKSIKFWDGHGPLRLVEL